MTLAMSVTTDRVTRADLSRALCLSHLNQLKVKFLESRRELSLV